MDGLMVVGKAIPKPGSPKPAEQTRDSKPEALSPYESGQLVYEDKLEEDVKDIRFISVGVCAMNTKVSLCLVVTQEYSFV